MQWKNTLMVLNNLTETIRARMFILRNEKKKKKALSLQIETMDVPKLLKMVFSLLIGLSWNNVGKPTDYQ